MHSFRPVDAGIAGRVRLTALNVQRCPTGKWIDICTRVPSICVNQCGVLSGTITQSPFASRRGVPPSMADPLRLSGFVRFSSFSFPPVTSVPDPTRTSCRTVARAWTPPRSPGSHKWSPTGAHVRHAGERQATSCAAERDRHCCYGNVTAIAATMTERFCPAVAEGSVEARRAMRLCST